MTARCCLCNAAGAERRLVCAACEHTSSEALRARKAAADTRRGELVLRAEATVADLVRRLWSRGRWLAEAAALRCR